MPNSFGPLIALFYYLLFFGLIVFAIYKVVSSLSRMSRSMEDIA